MKPISPYQHQILGWLRDNHPDEWVSLSGIQVQVSKGLKIRGLVELKGYAGNWRIRLTPGATA